MPRKPIGPPKSKKQVERGKLQRKPQPKPKGKAAYAHRAVAFVDVPRVHEPLLDDDDADVYVGGGGGAAAYAPAAKQTRPKQRRAAEEDTIVRALAESSHRHMAQRAKLTGANPDEGFEDVGELALLDLARRLALADDEITNAENDMVRSHIRRRIAHQFLSDVKLEQRNIKNRLKSSRQNRADVLSEMRIEAPGAWSLGRVTGVRRQRGEDNDDDDDSDVEDITNNRLGENVVDVARNMQEAQLRREELENAANRIIRKRYANAQNQQNYLKTAARNLGRTTAFAGGGANALAAVAQPAPRAKQVVTIDSSDDETESSEDEESGGDSSFAIDTDADSDDATGVSQSEASSQ